MTPIPFPAGVDSSMLNTFRSCQQKGWYSYFEHLQRVAKSAHLVAGGAFARGLEVFRLAFYRDGRTFDEARDAGARAIVEEWGDATPMFSWEEYASVKTLDRVLEALDYYFTVWPPATDAIKPIIRGDTAGVEFTFSIPLPGTRHPTTGDPIMYTGRFDMVGEYNGAAYAVDEKTAKSLGGTWMDQWTLRSQFTGYCWAAKQFGLPVVGAVIRGVAFLKNEFKSAECITYRPDWLIEKWLAETVATIDDMIAMWRRAQEGGAPRLNLGDACSAFGACPYLQLCSSQDPLPWKNDPTMFEIRKWDPLAKL